MLLGENGFEEYIAKIISKTQGFEKNSIKYAKICKTQANLAKKYTISVQKLSARRS